MLLPELPTMTSTIFLNICISTVYATLCAKRVKKCTILFLLLFLALSLLVVYTRSATNVASSIVLARPMIPTIDIFNNSKGSILHFAVQAYRDTDFTMARTWIYFMRLHQHNFVIVTDDPATFEFCLIEQISCFNGSYFADLYPRCTPANKGDHMGVMKVGFALEALRRGFDVVCSDIDTIWLQPFPIAFWKLARFDFWVSAYSDEFEGCSDRSMSFNYTYCPFENFYRFGVNYDGWVFRAPRPSWSFETNFGGWAFRSTSRAIEVVQNHFKTMISFDNPNPNVPKCDDQYSWNSFFMPVLPRKEYEIMAPCLFSQYIRYSKYMAKYREQIPNVVNLHMTLFFSPAQKVLFVISIK